MEPTITAERLQTLLGNDDYEPSGLVTPNDRAEIARRKAERTHTAAQAAPIRVKDDQDEAGAYRLLIAQKQPQY